MSAPTGREHPPGEDRGAASDTTPPDRTSRDSTVSQPTDRGKHDAAAVICPDCAAEAVDRYVTHEKTCPLGLAIDASCAADRAYFEKHPGSKVYWRAIRTSEVDELRMFHVIPDIGRLAGRVTVTRLCDGLRTRKFDELVIVIRDRDGVR
jgi:hypothetical protein